MAKTMINIGDRYAKIEAVRGRGCPRRAACVAREAARSLPGI